MPPRAPLLGKISQDDSLGGTLVDLDARDDDEDEQESDSDNDE